MATKGIAAAPEAISETSAKTQIADRPTEAQAVVDTRHADGTTTGNAPSVAGEQEQDAELISPAPADKIELQPVRATPDQPASKAQKAAKRSQALESNASGSPSLTPDMAVSGEYVDSAELRKPEERKVQPISRTDLSKPGTTMEHLHKMSVGELKVLDVLSNEGRQIIRTRLMAIWDEMSVRFERGESVNSISGTGGKGMGKYLRSIGVKPAKRRSWKFELLREETLRLAQETLPIGRKRPTKKEIVINSETEADLIAKAGVKVAQILADASMTPQESYNKAVAESREILRAIEDGQYEALKPLAHSENSPDSQKFEPVPEPDPNTLEGLRQRISRMADTDDIEPAVQKYVNELFAPLCEGGLVVTLRVSARREGRERVDAEDWVELISRGGTDNQLGRVVDRDKLGRPRIRWFENGGWQEPRSLFANSGDHPHVLSAAEAQDKYPDAVVCYPQTKPNLEDASAPVQSIAATPGTSKPPEGL